MHTRILVDGEPVTDWVNEQDRELHQYQTLEGETKTRSTLYLLSEMTKFKIGVRKLKRIVDKAHEDYYRERAEKYGMTVREARKRYHPVPNGMGVVASECPRNATGLLDNQKRVFTYPGH